MVRNTKIKIKMGKKIIRNRRPNGVITIAEKQNIMHAFVKKIKTYPIYIILIILK